MNFKDYAQTLTNIILFWFNYHFFFRDFGAMIQDLDKIKHQMYMSY